MQCVADRCGVLPCFAARCRASPCVAMRCRAFAETSRKCVAVCCSVLHAVRCSALQCVAVRCSALQCVAMRCSALQCVAVRCSALQCVAVRCSALQCVAMRCSALQCVAVRCSALQCVAVRCSVLQRVTTRYSALQAASQCGTVRHVHYSAFEETSRKHVRAPGRSRWHSAPSVAPDSCHIWMSQVTHRWVDTVLLEFNPESCKMWMRHFIFISTLLSYRVSAGSKQTKVWKEKCAVVRSWARRRVKENGRTQRESHEQQKHTTDGAPKRECQRKKAVRESLLSNTHTLSLSHTHRVSPRTSEGDREHSNCTKQPVNTARTCGRASYWRFGRSTELRKHSQCWVLSDSLMSSSTLRVAVAVRAMTGTSGNCFLKKPSLV